MTCERGHSIDATGLRNSRIRQRDETRLSAIRLLSRFSTGAIGHQLTKEVPGSEILSLDATDEGAPVKIFDVLEPDILVRCAGTFPPAAPARAKLAGVRRQLGDRRQDRISLLQGGAVAAFAEWVPQSF
jgi:hypothetical protein